MTTSYADEVLLERTEKRRTSRAWLQCYLAQAPPTFEDCKQHFARQGMTLSRTDYEDICKKMTMQPQYEKTSAS